MHSLAPLCLSEAKENAVLATSLAPLMMPLTVRGERERVKELRFSNVENRIFGGKPEPVDLATYSTYICHEKIVYTF